MITKRRNGRVIIRNATKNLLRIIKKISLLNFNSVVYLLIERFLTNEKNLYKRLKALISVMEI